MRQPCVEIGTYCGLVYVDVYSLPHQRYGASKTRYATPDYGHTKTTRLVRLDWLHPLDEVEEELGVDNTRGRGGELRTIIAASEFRT